MDYLTPALLFAVLGLVAYLAFFRKNPEATGSEAGNALLLRKSANNSRRPTRRPNGSATPRPKP